MVTSCVVSGCTNNAKNTRGQVPVVRFHKFPRLETHPERRAKWIRFACRKDRDGRPWEPSEGSRICSRHFLNNIPHFNERHPAYVPTIPPKASPKASSLRAVERFERLRKRKEEQDASVSHSKTDKPKELKKSDFTSQRGGETADKTESSIADLDAPAPAFTDFYECAVSSPIETRTVHFLGATTALESDDKMASLTGLKTRHFEILLGLLKFPQCRPDELLPEDKLLLTLMKLKGDDTFWKLGTIFGVDRATAGRVFKKILARLYTAASQDLIDSQTDSEMQALWASVRQFARHQEGGKGEIAGHFD